MSGAHQGHAMLREDVFHRRLGRGTRAASSLRWKTGFGSAREGSGGRFERARKQSTLYKDARHDAIVIYLFLLV